MKRTLFDTAAGIRAGGENHFVIAPVPGEKLSFAEARYRSLYGTVSSRREKTENGLEFEIEIPADCTAEIRLPDGRTEAVGTGTHTF